MIGKKHAGSPRAISRTLKVRGGIISQANIYLGGFCSAQRIFPPQIIQVLLIEEGSMSRPQSIYLTGPLLCRLMRRHRVTIPALAQRMQIPQTRIRHIRVHGLADRHAARDWLEAITGQDPGILYGPVSVE
jgi:hypothetical protein